eukprot:Skav212720  [mRNA]  locus=scaffold1734:34494:35015:+ [translate_table: standard]
MPQLKKKAKLTRPQPKSFGFSKRANRAFKAKHGVNYSGKDSTRQPWGVNLAQVQQPSFEEIVLKSQKQCQRLLEEHNVLPEVNGQQRQETMLLNPCWEASREWPDVLVLLEEAHTRQISLKGRASWPSLQQKSCTRVASTMSWPQLPHFAKHAAMAPSNSVLLRHSRLRIMDG